MSVTPGHRFRTYDVVELLGSGGMGDVYRARDSVLRRDVALKVLPMRHRLDDERQARFKREGRALASLNHPNIATVHGIEEEADVQALVMELVDGHTLADRLDLKAAKASGLPIPEALAIASQIVDALEAAHQRGIVHRDLKPSNIKIRYDELVKVLDFGLAKALEAADGCAGVDAATISITAPQAVLGTPAYMSPEQARGQEVNQQTDIWAFGCVLYEMLTGLRAFDGSTSSDVIAAVLEREPDYSRLPADTPFLVRRLVRRCLQKEPRHRLRDIADARLDLDDAVNASGSAAHDVPLPPRSRLARLWAVAIATVCVLTAVSIIAMWLWPRREGVAEPVHMTVLLPAGVTVTRGPGRLLSLALSPDGRTLVIARSDGKGERLYRRTLDRPEATPLAGAEGGTSPFFSPDGAWVGFFADRRLKRVPAGGGTAIDLAAAPGFPAGASWGSDDRIVIGGFQATLQVVDARGGTPEDLMSLGPGLGHLYPEFLPDGRTVLFSEEGWTHAFDLVSRRRTDRIIKGEGVRYSPNGYLLLTRPRTTLLAAPFDATRLEVNGPLLPISEGVDIERTVGVGYLAVSRRGTVAFLPSAPTFALVLVEPDGRERLIAEHLMLENPRFSPDGRRLVVAAVRNPGEQSDLWVHDLAGGTPAYRLTLGGGRAPVWSRDGSAVTYSHLTGDERSGIYSRSADGRGEARQIVAVPTFHWLVGWTPRQTLAYGVMEPTPKDRGPASSIVAVTGTQSRRIVGPGRTWGGRLSPDGRWLVYYAADSGYFEVYVTPFGE